MSRALSLLACGLVAGLLFASPPGLEAAPAGARNQTGRRTAKLDPRTRRLLEIEANKRFRRGTAAVVPEATRSLLSS